MRNLILRLLVNAAALWAAAYVVTGVNLTQDLQGVLGVALVFGLVNALIKPVFQLLTFPLILLTLGLATLLINALMLMLTARLTASLTVDGFGPALVGALVVSVVSMVMMAVLKDKE